ncbi:hypothetical protein BJV77DRAFT_453790 [Russula vinacea]|nr:hypothetical protein BJV77DRAFT_453790 [Russula vinacea]
MLLIKGPANHSNDAHQPCVQFHLVPLTRLSDTNVTPHCTPLILILLFGFAAAGIYAPDCSLSWEWTFNSLGQNACTVAAFMMSTCNGGSFTINALPGPSYSYSGPAVLTTLICASATPSHIPSLVHVTHARDRSGFRTIPIVSFPRTPGLCI